VPVLAERWEAPDPRTWLLYLRQGVKYADGTPFDAEVVKFSVDRHLDPKTKSKQIGELLSIDEVEVVDTSTVRSGGVQIAEDLPLQNVERMRGASEFTLSERPGARFYMTRWNTDDEYGKSLELH
jgi:ABC-type transport system substrate-binding protein